MKTVTCPREGCGEENREDALYCVKCGSRIGGGTCQCGAEVPVGASFCANCGGAVEHRVAADMGRRASRRREAGIRWVRDDHDVATRIAPSDLKGFLERGLEVQPGTRALYFVGGRYVATLPPGRHALETLGQRLKIPTDGEPTAIVVDDGELGLEFEIAGLHAADHHNVLLRAQASLRLAEPELFIANMLRDLGRFTVNELQAFLKEEVQQSLRELVARHSAEELYTGRVRAEAEMELLSRWRATLDRTGFALNRFRVLAFELPGLEEAEDKRSEVGDALAVRLAEREGREAYFDADLADFQLGTERERRKGVEEGRREEVKVDLEVDKLRRDIDRLSRRNPLLERLMQEGMLQRMTELKTTEEELKFWRQVDKEEVLDKHEREEVRRVAEAQAVEAEAKRRLLFRKFSAIAEAELEELKLKQGLQLKMLEMRGDADVVEEMTRQELQKLDAELVSRRKVFEQKLTESDRLFAQEREQKKSEADLQLFRLERMEALRQMAKDKEASRQLQEKLTVAEIESKRLAREADMYGMMTAEQILSVAVARSPERAAEIAEAFRAMKSGEATARERELYERMLSEVKASNERAQDLDHKKFVASVDADVRHRERREVLDEEEKNRTERVAVAGLTADDKKRAQWSYCTVHEMKHVAGTDCPLCVRDRGY